MWAGRFGLGYAGSRRVCEGNNEEVNSKRGENRWPEEDDTLMLDVAFIAEGELEGCMYYRALY